MTRYRVPVADAFLEDREHWQAIDGFRFISAGWPWDGHPYITICTFEDDGAPAELEGKLVEPMFRQELLSDITSGEPSFLRDITIINRKVIG